MTRALSNEVLKRMLALLQLKNSHNQKKDTGSVVCVETINRRFNETSVKAFSCQKMHLRLSNYRCVNAVIMVLNAV